FCRDEHDRIEDADTARAAFEAHWAYREVHHHFQAKRSELRRSTETGRGVLIEMEAFVRDRLRECEEQREAHPERGEERLDVGCLWGVVLGEVQIFLLPRDERRRRRVTPTTLHIPGNDARRPEANHLRRPPRGQA